MGSLLALLKRPKDKVKAPPKEPECIWCNLCLEVCESGLWPALLLKESKAGRYDDCQKHGIEQCTDCGNCTFECPLGIPLYKYLRTARVLSLHRGSKNGLIPVLLEVQASFGYLPEDRISSIARFLNVTVGHIYSVASFYKRLRLTPPGRQHVMVCLGTACHISDGPHILRQTEKALGLQEGETSRDREYTLDAVACIGCCALAPCLTINGQVHGKLDDDKVEKLFPPRDNGDDND